MVGKPEGVGAFPAAIAAGGVGVKECILAGIVGAALCTEHAVTVLAKAVAATWVCGIWVIAALA